MCIIAHDIHGGCECLPASDFINGTKVSSITNRHFLNIMAADL